MTGPREDSSGVGMGSGDGLILREGERVQLGGHCGLGSCVTSLVLLKNLNYLVRAPSRSPCLNVEVELASVLSAPSCHLHTYRSQGPDWAVKS
jgi:hypothetical protein